MCSSSSFNCGNFNGNGNPKLQPPLQNTDTRRRLYEGEQPVSSGDVYQKKFGVTEQVYPRPSVIRSLPPSESRLLHVSYQGNPRDDIKDGFIMKEVEKVTKDGGKSVGTVEAQCWSNERKSSLKKYLREAAASRLFSPNSQSLKIYHEKPVSSSSESVRKRLKVDRMVELKSVVTSSVHKNKLKAVFEPKTSE